MKLSRRVLELKSSQARHVQGEKYDLLRFEAAYARHLNSQFHQCVIGEA